MRRRSAVAALAAAACLLLTGCWDERPIEQLGFVTLVAFDGTPQHVDAYVQATIPTTISSGAGGGGSTGRTFEVYHASGPDELSALRGIELQSSKSLWFGQIEAVLISDRLAKAGGAPGALDYFMREPKTRTIAWVYIVPHGHLGSLLETKPPDVSYPAQALVNRDQSEKAIAQFQPARVFDTFQGFYDPGRDAAVPTVTADAGHFVYGQSVVFSQRKATATLSPVASRGLPILDNTGAQTMPLTMTCDRTGVLSVQLYRPRTSLSAVVEGGRLRALRADVRGTVHVTQASNCPGTLSTMAAMNHLAARASQSLYGELAQTIAETQGADSDPFGFGDVVRAMAPSLWTVTGARWHEVYRHTPIILTVRLRPGTTGLLRKGESDAKP